MDPHKQTVQSYSDEALDGAIRQMHGRESPYPWERGRLEALEAERTRRNAKRRGKAG